MYYYKKKFIGTIEEAYDKIVGELKKEGFGVLTEIDVKETLKAKLNKEFDKYMILGACNPQLAFKSLSIEKEIGLLLPCNVIVFENKGEVFVSAILPTKALRIVQNNSLKPIAIEAEKKLKKTIDLATN